MYPPPRIIRAKKERSRWRGSALKRGGGGQPRARKRHCPLLFFNHHVPTYNQTMTYPCSHAGCELGLQEEGDVLSDMHDAGS